MGRRHALGTPAFLVAAFLLFALTLGGCGSRDAASPAPGAQQPSAAPQADLPRPASTTSNTLPRILEQPQNVITRENEVIILEVTADGVPPPSYQWSKDDREIPGATAPTYRVQTARPSDAGRYHVAVTNAAGSVLSQRVGVVVETAPAAPVITGPPQDLVVTETDPSSMKVVAKGTPPLSYLWSKDGRPGFLSNEAELLFVSPKPEDSGTYTVEVSNLYGKAMATCRLTVNPRLAAIFSGSSNRIPRILSQPQNVMTRENEPITLQVTAEALPLPTYQWSKDGADILGATDATYRVSRARMSDAGTYRVAVTNAAGSAVSNPVLVTVLEAAGVPPMITTPPLDLTVIEGNQASFRVMADGTPPLSYLWSKEGRAGFASNEAQLFLASARPEDGGTYMVEVSNRYGKTTAFCRLTVTPRFQRP